MGLVQPYMYVANNWESQQAGYPLDRPLPTQTAGNHFGLVEPIIIPQLSCGVPRGMNDPVPTITTTGAHALVQPFVAAIGQTGGGDRVRGITEPIASLVSKQEQCLVEPFIISYYGKSLVQSIHEPFATLTTRDRFGVVMQYGLDILFRMFQPHELALAHSFPRDYRFAGNKGEVVKQIGNSVPSKTSEELCYAALSA